MSEHAARTLDEVAEIMTQRGYPMTKQGVKYHEKRAIKKLCENATVLRLWNEME